METGTYISGLGHAAILLWALIGGLFLSADDATPVQVAEVSLISDQEFAAMVLPDVAPDVPVSEPVAQPPEPDDAAPDVSPGGDAELQKTEPADVAQPDRETLPEPPEVQPQPPVEVNRDAPVLPEPPSDGESAVVDAKPDEVAKPTAAPRIAPVPAAEAPPDSDIAETATPEVVPDEKAENPVEEKPATAPKEAASEIVTEAETPASSLMASSKRPISRPPRPKPAPETKSQDDAIDDILAEVAAEKPAPARAAPSGPPLTGGERDGFRIAVQQCWVVDVGSQAANVTVTVAFSLDQSGKVIKGSLKMIGSEGGEGSPVETAFSAARRAILRCQKGGYDLPGEKYSQWRDVEMTFNPKNMRIK